MMTKLLHLLLLLLFLSSSACRKKEADDSFEHAKTNAIYFWKTKFRLSPQELNFLNTNNIYRIYLRMFDVDLNTEPAFDLEKAIPIGTLNIDFKAETTMRNELSDREFVPVVYITLDALKAMKDNEGGYARQIVERVDNMVTYHGIPNVEELQLDCDWTLSTEDSYFALCDSVKQVFESHSLPWRLSSTIRLHQLNRPTPPVDYGVLMVYNTGDFKDPDTRNSIIDRQDVEPYLKYLSRYPLHLDVAYPTYSWQLLFRKRQFMGLMRNVDLQDSIHFKSMADGNYQVLADIPYGDRVLRRGDLIRHEESHPDAVVAVKDQIEKKLANSPHSNILYHLDYENLSTFTPDEITELYSSAR